MPRTGSRSSEAQSAAAVRTEVFKVIYLVTYLFDLCGKVVEVDKQVYPCVRKCRHASVMVCIRIDVIHSNGIDAQLPHQRHIPLTLFRVDQRVFGNELISNPWKNGLSMTAMKDCSRWEEYSPLRKNCLPSSVKNLDPTAVMGEIANTWITCRHANSTKPKATAGGCERVSNMTGLIQK